MDESWGGERTPESRRYSSSVRMVLRERLMPALSPIVERERCKYRRGKFGNGVGFDELVVCGGGMLVAWGLGKTCYVIVSFTWFELEGKATVEAAE